MFKDKTILLGVSGGIAVYKAVELLRLLTKAGATVHVVMTKNACEFVTPLTFQTLSGNPVHTELFNLYQEHEIGHIALADRADLVILAPATANLIGKIAQGLADDLLTTTVMATKAPVLLVPAMNTNMYENPLYQRNEKLLADCGYHVLAPVSGDLACGWVGTGKMPEPQAIMDKAKLIMTPKDLAGCRMLVTAGPTHEEIDPVRYLSNRSSGKMGYAIAAAARRRGAEVVLVSGPSRLSVPADVEFVSVTSAGQMRDAVAEKFPQVDVVIKAAAVADYRPCVRNDQKMKKQGATLRLELEPTTDILAELGKNKKHQILIGFAAETEKLLEYATDKLRRKNLDLMVANDVSLTDSGFDADSNIVQFLYPDGHKEALDRMSKEDVANELLDRMKPLWLAKQGQLDNAK